MRSIFYDTVHKINIRDYSLEQVNAWAPSKEVTDEWSQRIESGKTRVAMVEGRIVGFATMSKSKVDLLYVHHEYQGKGVGKALLKAIEKKLRKKVRMAEVEASITARPFFETRGYRLIRENRGSSHGVEFLNYIMEKPLPSEPRLTGMKKAKHVFPWRELLTNKIFDLLIVITGVSIAFQLNNWKLEADAKALEKFYMRSLVTDLTADIEDMNSIMKDLRNDRSITNAYLANRANYPPDSLAMTFRAILSLETFGGHQNTYLTLTNGNGINTFSDQKIVELITTYYESYSSIRRFESVYTNVIIRMNDYFSPAVDYTSWKVTKPEVALQHTTGNWLLIAGSQLNGGLEDYEEALENATKLKSVLEAKLQN